MGYAKSLLVELIEKEKALEELWAERGELLSKDKSAIVMAEMQKFCGEMTNERHGPIAENLVAGLAASFLDQITIKFFRIESSDWLYNYPLKLDGSEPYAIVDPDTRKVVGNTEYRGGLIFAFTDKYKIYFLQPFQKYVSNNKE